MSDDLECPDSGPPLIEIRSEPYDGWCVYVDGKVVATELTHEVATWRALREQRS